MGRHYKGATVSTVLPTIMHNLVNHGDEVGSRNGRVKEFLNARITLTEPRNREILCGNRGANVYAQIAETMWVLSGRNDIEWLSAYLPRAGDFSDDGETWRGGYGPRIRRWRSKPDAAMTSGDQEVDQLDHIVELLREDPLSRRAVIAIYDPRVDTSPGKDIPCNDFLQFQSRLGELHLTVTVRSNDAMWGWSGINAFEWSTLQEIVASMLGIRVGTLTFNIGSLHLYDRHWAKAASIQLPEDRTWEPVAFDPYRVMRSVGDLDDVIRAWFRWEDMCRKGEANHEALKVSGIAHSPLLVSWAKAIAHYWDPHGGWGVGDIALAAAMAKTPRSVLPAAHSGSQGGGVGGSATNAPVDHTLAYYAFVHELHTEKHQSYGDSWKKRGEKLSILPNIARKVDRLGVGDKYDSASDTLTDLLVYSVKYLCWLTDCLQTPHNVTQYLHLLHDPPSTVETNTATVEQIADDYNAYLDRFELMHSEDKRDAISRLVSSLVPLARDVWVEENEYKGADVD